jgi:hypothetical protein
MSMFGPVGFTSAKAVYIPGPSINDPYAFHVHVQGNPDGAQGVELQVVSSDPLKLQVMGWFGPVIDPPPQQPPYDLHGTYPGKYQREILVNDVSIEVDEIPRDQMDEFVRSLSPAAAAAA